MYVSPWGQDEQAEYLEKEKKLLESQKKEVEDYHQTMW